MDEGAELSENYRVGVYYPVYILTNSNGEVIFRWTGYTGANRFIKSLREATSDLSTINERIEKSESKPVLKDIIYLAGYHADIGEYLEAIKYYKQAQNLGGGVYDYTYKIFENTANASWKDILTFNDVLPVADAVLNSNKKNINDIVMVAKIMSRLARKKEKTNQLTKYLQAGIDATADSRIKKLKESYNLFTADKALYVDLDTTKAIDMKKENLGPGWQDNPEKFYNFAKWCLERKVNLDEAEMYTRKAIQLAMPGKFRARVLNTLAEISYTTGRTDEAIMLMKQVVDEDPGNLSYIRRLEQYQENSGD